MKVLLIVVIIILFIFLCLKYKENFEYKMIDLSVSENKSESQIQMRQSNNTNNVNCSEIFNPEECNVHENKCVWEELGSNNYVCNSVCDSLEYKNNSTLCIENDDCNYDSNTFTCTKKENINSIPKLNCEDIDTYEKCDQNKDKCFFSENKCYNKNNIEHFNTSQFHLAPPGAFECKNSQSISQAKCSEIGNEFAKNANKLPGRPLQVGNGGTCLDGGWGNVPLGCSVQSDGDWAPHYKTDGIKQDGCVSTDYQLVCHSPPSCLNFDDNKNACESSSLECTYDINTGFCDPKATQTSINMNQSQLASTCEMSEREKNWSIVFSDDPTTYTCQDIQNKWGTCTNENDHNHQLIRNACPSTCANARGDTCPELMPICINSIDKDKNTTNTEMCFFGDENQGGNEFKCEEIGDYYNKFDCNYTIGPNGKGLCDPTFCLLGQGSEFNAGFGDCSTYGPGGVNSYFCTDKDINTDITAEQACSECGKCLNSA